MSFFLRGSFSAVSAGLFIIRRMGRPPSALFRTQRRRCPPALHRTQCGASVAPLEMTLTVNVTASRRQAAWRSPAGPGRGLWGRLLAPLGVTLRLQPGGAGAADARHDVNGNRHREPPQAAWRLAARVYLFLNGSQRSRSSPSSTPSCYPPDSRWLCRCRRSPGRACPPQRCIPRRV